MFTLVYKDIVIYNLLNYGLYTDTHKHAKRKSEN